MQLSLERHRTRGTLVLQEEQQQLLPGQGPAQDFINPARVFLSRVSTYRHTLRCECCSPTGFSSQSTTLSYYHTKHTSEPEHVTEVELLGVF